MMGHILPAVSGAGVLFAQKPPQNDPMDVAIAVGAFVAVVIGSVGWWVYVNKGMSGRASKAPAIPPPGASNRVAVLPWTRQQAWVGSTPRLPPELNSLGSPLSVHRCNENKNTFMPFRASTPPSDHIVFADALVTLDGERCGVFPWDAIACSVRNPWDLRWPLRTVDGVEFLITLDVNDGNQLYNTICRMLLEIHLPGILTRIEKGEAVSFGDKIAVARDGLVQREQLLSWSDLTSLKIISMRGNRQLFVRGRGMLMEWARVSLNDMPNESVFLEVVKRLCPPHLLMTSEQPKGWF